MEVQAVLRSARISPRKARLIAELIRGKKAEQAVAMLSLVKKRGAEPLYKTLKSAIANAKNNAKLTSDALIVSVVDVMEGPALKRFHPSTRGRIHPYKKRSSHIRIVLQEKGAVK